MRRTRNTFESDGTSLLRVLEVGRLNRWEEVVIMMKADSGADTGGRTGRQGCACWG